MKNKNEKRGSSSIILSIFSHGKLRFVLLGIFLIAQLYIWPALYYMLKRSSSSTRNTSNSIALNPSEIFSNPLISMDHPGCIALVTSLLVQPSKDPYNFTNKDLENKADSNPSAGQTQAVVDILEGFGRGGFFIDCGANDGEWYSNTIWVERMLGWSGLLLEPDPQVYPRLVSKRRKAYMGNFCLSDTTYPKTVEFYVDKIKGLGSGLIKSDQYWATTAVNVSCFPLYSILLALNRTTVDFFSLDIEGSEIRVLQTVPFDKVIFKVITIEHNVLKEGKKGLRKFMEGHGYIFYRTVVTEDFAAGDSIFIHKSVNLTAAQKMRIGSEDKEKVRAVRE